MLCILCRVLRKNPNVGACRPRRSRSFGTAAVAAEPSPITADNQYEQLARVVTPLYETPYEEQLSIKREWAQGVVRNFAEKLHQRSRDRRRVHCYVSSVRPSPVTEGYRNKDELNFQTGVDGNPKTLGFFVGSPADGPVVCVRPTHLRTLRQSHKDVAQVYEDYVRASALPACLHFSDGGHWRSLVVRSNEAGDVMANIVFHPRDLPQDRLQEEADKLRDYFVSRCKLTSLYFQPCRNTRCDAVQAPHMHLLGDTDLKETLGGFRFRISADSFFQVNTLAAEVLYQEVLQVAHVTARTTLLDICCGTGTISILASPYVRGAIGVDSITSAVRDANVNALVNDVTNVEFVAGLAEKKIPAMVAALDLASDLVAVVNPGRSGLHARAVQALCKCSSIRRLVYVSCKADSHNTVTNFVQLCELGQFRLHKVVPVDMFPHTTHTELVMMFVR